MPLVLTNATLIDGGSPTPKINQSILIEGNRISAIYDSGAENLPDGATAIDLSGKYIIPGLMDANVHLLLDMRLENLVRFEGRYDDLIIEAAQVALRSGLTTVFDTYGPRAPLLAARDKISAGDEIGARIFCAGNIVGLDGPFSEDFFTKVHEVASQALIRRINKIWVCNVGPELTWQTPEHVANELRSYLASGIDFIKYASSEHRIMSGPSAFLAFSSEVQEAIVREAHEVGTTAQAHTTSVEALRVAISAGCDIIQHANVTGPVLIPDSTLDLAAERRTGCTVFPFKQSIHDRMAEKYDAFAAQLFATSDQNIRALVARGAKILLATDAGVLAREASSDPVMGKSWITSSEDNLGELGQGHFHWLEAMEEKGMAPHEILKAATSNIAEAYGKQDDLGTLEAGKLADLVVLERNPLQTASNYRSIHMVIKDGAIVELGTLPRNPVLTKPNPDGDAELQSGPRIGSGFPLCC